MNNALAFIRIFFLFLCVFFTTNYAIFLIGIPTPLSIAIGISAGIAFSFLLFGFDTFLKKFNLRSFNITLIGLFIGYLTGLALNIIFNTIINLLPSSAGLNFQVIAITNAALFLFCVYLGVIMTLRSADELHLSIPFIKLTPLTRKKKDLLVDASALADSRIIDLASSGLVDHHLIIPRFLLKELYLQAESPNELSKNKANRCLEAIKKMEEIHELELRFNDTDFTEIKDTNAKLIRLSRLLDANLLTADMSRVEIAGIEGIRVINLNGLSNALKPLMQTGEHIKIKIQRYGKEPRQGIGYLDDGTMVVVNGGGEYIGEIIDSQVLSVKHTSSGRMIFCNAMEENDLRQNYERAPVT